MRKTLDHFKEQMVSIRCGIPTVGLIDTIKVEYNNQTTPIKHLARTTPEDGRIKIEPYDVGMLFSIDKVLKAAGFNSYIFSKTSVVVSLPKIANAIEKDKVIAQIRKLEEEAKVALRNIRKKTRQKLTEDERKKSEKQLQKLTDEYIDMVTSIANKKVNSL